MGDTAISWTDKTWNPIRGCSRVSAGCTRCYAERVAARFAIVEHLRQAFAALIELDKYEPREVDAIAAMIVGHVRSWRPLTLSEFAPREVRRG